MPTGFALPSYAKINWILKVIGRRGDGFHDLCTIFQTVSLCDTLEFEDAERIELYCDAPNVPNDGANIVVRAAEALRSSYGIDRGARLTLRKRIPAPGGLAGGSSNAATALIGLCRLWSIAPSLGELKTIAAALGSDVPYFLCGGTALGTGRGTEIEPLAEAYEAFMLVVTPSVDVPTADAFRGLGAKRLTKTDSKRILKLCRKEAESFDSRLSVLKNDFEASVLRLHPEIGRVKTALADAGARSVLMSGSGASVFAVFDKEETRQATMKALELEPSWRMFAVSTVSREIFREALGECATVVSD